MTDRSEVPFAQGVGRRTKSYNTTMQMPHPAVIHNETSLLLCEQCKFIGGVFMQNIITAFDGAMDFLKGLLRAAFVPMKSFLDNFANPWFGIALSTIVFLALFFVCIKREDNDFGEKIKNPRTIAICAMLIAINVVLESFAQDLTAYIRVSFAFVTLPVATVMFGPLVGCAVGILQDVAGFIVRPTGAWLVVLTIDAGIAGMISGLVLYKKKVTLLRVFIAELLIVLCVNIILNSAGLAPTVGSGLAGILPSRIIKNILLLPVQMVVVYAVLRMVRGRIKK